MVFTCDNKAVVNRKILSFCFLIHESNIWIYVISCVCPVSRLGACLAKTFTLNMTCKLFIFIQTFLSCHAYEYQNERMRFTTRLLAALMVKIFEAAAITYRHHWLLPFND